MTSTRLFSEREAFFLLRALQTMLAEEELLANANDVVIVAARKAWPEYNELHAYVCSRIDHFSKCLVWASTPREASIHWCQRFLQPMMKSKW